MLNILVCRELQNVLHIKLFPDKLCLRQSNCFDLEGIYKKVFFSNMIPGAVKF